jgi:hypothetical protein
MFTIPPRAILRTALLPGTSFADIPDDWFARSAARARTSFAEGIADEAVAVKCSQGHVPRPHKRTGNNTYSDDNTNERSGHLKAERFLVVG